MYLTNRWTRVGLAFLMTGFLILCLSQLAAGANPADRTAVSQQNDTRKLQETLRDKGYYDGRIDGVAGPRTRAGLRRYRQAEGLPVTGRVDEGTAGKLGVGPESVGGN